MHIQKCFYAFYGCEFQDYFSLSVQVFGFPAVICVYTRWRFPNTADQNKSLFPKVSYRRNSNNCIDQ